MTPSWPVRVLLCLAGFVVAAIVTPPATARPPNVIFILADDLGQRDLGCYGSTFYETPNIDALAARGMRFTDAYAACNVCSPTRAAILTGKYPARLHLTDWLPGKKDSPAQKLNRPAIIDHLARSEVTLAQALQEGGYATAFFGKWHLGGPAFYPDKFGFDVNVGGCEKGHPPSYFSPYAIPTLPDGPKGEYLTDRLTTEACNYIESHKDKPFLVYLSHYAVHNPQQAKPEVIQHFKTKAVAATSTESEFLQDLGRKVRMVQNHPVYAANLASLDESVGRVAAKLRDLGLERDTVVIFTSDNGGLSTSEGTPTSNAPWRMGKGWNYEGGIREPLIVAWPGVAKAGSLCDVPTISTDFYPTFLNLAGLPARPAQHLDGVSITPLLKGETLPQRPLFWHYPHYSNQGGPPGGAIRLGDYKLIEHFEDRRVELYNLKDDPGEQL
jgi:arylsulfatase A-like enzyme